MNEFLLENLAKFFYDTSKLSFVGLVLTVVAKKPLIASDLITGIFMTLSLLVVAVIISVFKKRRN